MLGTSKIVCEKAKGPDYVYPFWKVAFQNTTFFAIGGAVAPGLVYLLAVAAQRFGGATAREAWDRPHWELLLWLSSSYLLIGAMFGFFGTHIPISRRRVRALMVVLMLIGTFAIGGALWVVGGRNAGGIAIVPGVFCSLFVAIEQFSKTAELPLWRRVLKEVAQAWRYRK